MLRQGNQLAATKLLPELGTLCPQVQEAGCTISFYWLSAAIMQQQQYHAKALRLNAVAKPLRSMLGLDATFEKGNPTHLSKRKAQRFLLQNNCSVLNQKQEV
jgi:hypothetical protein